MKPDSAEQDTDSCVLNPLKNPGEKGLPETGVLACNPADAGSFKDLAAQHGLTSRFLFHSRLYAGKDLFLAGPAVGAPMAALCLEKLIALGARKIILYGWCGSLRDDLHAMDVLVPTSGLSEEGTSHHYQVGSGSKIVPSPSLREQVCSALSNDTVDFHQGPVWTTDAPYRETRKKVADYAAKGIYGVDMEYSALCSVAVFRRVQLAAVMLVSDELRQPEWKPHYSFKIFKKKSRELLALLCDAAQSDNVLEP